LTTNYASELQRLATPSYQDQVAKSARALLEKYGVWIDKYRGGVPRGWAAAVMYWESNGQFNAAGDASLGEVGFYQVAATTPTTFGMPASSRMDPETNVFLGLLEYQYDAARWKATFPTYVKLATDDSYKLARLSFAIGWGGSTGLAKQAIAAGDCDAGNLYEGIARYVERTGGVALGSQSADKVWFRVLSIRYQWEIGKKVAWSPSGPPERVTPPPGVSYTIPLPYAVLFVDSIPIAFTIALAVGAYVLWRLI
jgi:hypothetical protein